MDTEPGGFSVCLLRQHDLREHLRAPPPRRAQPLEHRPVPITLPGQPLIQARHLNRDRACRGHSASPGPGSAPAPASQPLACRVHAAPGAASPAREYTATGRRPAPSCASTVT